MILLVLGRSTKQLLLATKSREIRSVQQCAHALETTIVVVNNVSTQRKNVQIERKKQS